MIVVDGVRYRDEDAARLGLAETEPAVYDADKAPSTTDADTDADTASKVAHKAAAKKAAPAKKAARKAAPNKARSTESTGTK